MIWQQPWAWAGAAAVLLPVLIHLLGFGRAQKYSFPSLRFLQSSRLLPTRRTRIHDPWLLLVRALIVLMAVAALAQPLFDTAQRRESYQESLARVVILDTSSSAQRATARAGWRADSARALAIAFADSASVSRMLETANVGTAVVGATYWLKAQAQRREIVVLSDFQIGELAEEAVRSLPDAVGFHPVRIGALGGEADVPGAVVANDTTAADTVPERASAVPLLLAGASQSVRIGAAFEAAQRMSARSLADNAGTRLDRMRNVIVVTDDYPARDSVLSSAGPMQSAWVLRVLHEVRSHRLLAGQSIALRGMQGQRDAEPLLLLQLSEQAPAAAWLSVAAALYDVMPRIDAQGALLSRSSELAELEIATVPDSVLRSWQKQPSNEPEASEVQRAFAVESATPGAQANASGPTSDARWLWVLVLVLLGVEAFMRRRMSRDVIAGAAPVTAPAAARAA